jgi:hypothetical protein
MAFAHLSAAGKDTVRALDKSTQDKGRVNPACTHYSDGSQVGWILEPGHPGSIGSSITAPVTEKTQNFWAKIITHQFTSLLSIK